MKAGVLALQGDFREHAAMFAACGATPILVRTTEDLATVDCLAIPGGESTTIAKLARAYGLIEPIKDRAFRGMPVFGTCAGMIVMANRVRDGEPLLSLLDVAVRRNAYGRQVDSFVGTVEAPALGGEMPAVFIRAPKIRRVGGGVEVLATRGGEPVLVRQGHVVAATFHPELTDDDRVHRLCFEASGRRRKSA